MKRLSTKLPANASKVAPCTVVVNHTDRNLQAGYSLQTKSLTEAETFSHPQLKIFDTAVHLTSVLNCNKTL